MSRMQAGRSSNGRRCAALLGLCLLTAGACATTSALRDGQRAERAEDFDRAVVEYTKAVRERPDDYDARTALARVRLKAAEEHFFRGRRLAAEGRYEQAVVEFQLASELNPTSGEIDVALKDIRQKLRTKIAVSRDGKTELQALVERSRDMPLPGLELPDSAKLPDAMVFSSASSRMVFTAIARFAQLSIAFDPGFREQTLSLDLRNVTLTEALDSLAATTNTFYRVTSPKTITIIPDTPAKRREYEEAVVRTFFLSNADTKEVIDLLRIVMDVRQVSAITANNSVSLKDTPERIAAAARLISAIDKARPEVVINVELLEVDRSRLKEYGIQIASPGSPPIGIDGTVDVNRPNFTLENLLNLTQADVFLTGVPGIYYRLLKQDTNTRTLASPQLRTAEGIAAQARFGERVPVPVTTFAPLAGGGVNQQPITSFVYEPIGVNIDITPRTHHDDDVTLALKVVLSAVSGTGFGGLPTFANREISTTIRLKDGETNMLAGLIRDEERTVLSGIPGLSDLPLIGRLFASNHKDTRQTDIILTLTPHIVRVLDLSEGDLRPFKVGRDLGSPVDRQDLLRQPPRDPALPEGETPAVPGLPTPPAATFPQPLQPPLPPGITSLPGTSVPVNPPKKPGGGGTI